jgi:two-component system, sensor histidine kinase PdtaS
MNAGSVRLNVNASIPCGLILNELITNAFKYAFPDQRSGTIRVSMAECEDGCVEIETSDDGIGMPAHLFEAEGEAGGSLGLTLVRLLVEQLDGSLTVELDQGTKFRIRFPKRSPA